MKLSKLVLSCILTLFISACSSDDIDSILDGEGENQYDMINASNHNVDYYFALEDVDGDNPDVMQRKYHKANLEKGQIQSTLLDRKVLREWFIGIEAPNKTALYKTARLTPKKRKKYLVLAWGPSNGLSLSILERHVVHRNAVLNVRFFATEPNLAITLEGTNIATQVGEVTSHFTVDNCISSLKVNDKPVDLCDLTVNESYLVILNSEGAIMSVLE